MSRATSPSTNRPHSLARGGRVWQVRRSTFSWRRKSQNRPDQSKSPGPEGPYGEVELVEHIKAVLAQSPYPGESHRQVCHPLRSPGTHETGSTRIWRRFWTPGRPRSDLTPRPWQSGYVTGFPTRAYLPKGSPVPRLWFWF